MQKIKSAAFGIDNFVGSDVACIENLVKTTKIKF